MKELYEYLKAWNEWRLNGAPQGEPFFRQCGLCTNTYQGINDNYALGQKRKGQLCKALIYSGLNPEYPFNYGRYREHSYHQTQHLDPLRIEWVEEFIRKYEEEERNSLDLQVVWDMEYPVHIGGPYKGHKS